MKRYLFAPSAVRDLDDIWLHFAETSTDHADRVVLKIRDEVRKIAEMPGIGHWREDLPDPALRAWCVWDYLIIYNHESEPLEIVRIIHGARDLPQIM